MPIEFSGSGYLSSIPRTIKIGDVRYRGTWVLTQYTTKSVDSAVIQVAGLENIPIDKTEVAIYDQDETTKIFSGQVMGVSGKELKEIVAYSYSHELQRIIPDNTLYENKTPEYIVSDLITNYTSMTFSSTVASGITLIRFPILDETLAVIIEKLENLLNWQIRTDVNKNFYFEPEGYTTSSIVLNVGTNCTLPNWKTDKGQMATRIRLKGSAMSFFKSESFAGPGTSFTLTYTPIGSVYVTVGGVAKEGGLQGDGKDYYVDTENKKIVFSASSSTVVAEYNYLARFDVENEIKESADTYDDFHAVKDAKYIQSTSDMRKYAASYLSKYSSPNETTEVETAEKLAIGTKVRIIDSIHRKDGFYIATKIVRRSNGKITVTLGTEEKDVNDASVEMAKKIKELEKQDTVVIITQKMRLATGTTNNTLSTTTLRQTRTIGNSFILGHATNSKMDDIYLLGWQGSAYSALE